MKRPVRVILVGMLLFTIAAGSEHGLAGELDPAVLVNDTVITRQRVQKSVEALMQAKHLNYGGITKPAQYKDLERQVVEELIAQELLWQEASRQGFVATTAEVDQAIEQQRKQYPSEQAYHFDLQRGGFTPESYAEDVKRHLSVRHFIEETMAKSLAVTSAEIHEAFVANRAQLMESEQVRVRHLLIKVLPDADEAAIAEARATVERALSDLKAGGDFAEVAGRYSQDATAANGGDLGFAPRGAFVQPFEDTAFTLKVGEVSDVIRTRFGFHLIKAEARREARALTESEAEPRLRQYLGSKKLQEAIQRTVDILRAQGNVDVKMAS